jgi:hypothetical protein
LEEACGKIGITRRDFERVMQERDEEKRKNALLRPLSWIISFALGLGAGALWFMRPLGPTYPYCVGAATAISTMSRPRLLLAWIVVFIVGFVVSNYALAPYVFWETHERTEFFGVEPYYGVFGSHDLTIAAIDQR